jgi:pimeloyl-ACP methyl ester carboxylesterase
MGARDERARGRADRRLDDHLTMAAGGDTMGVGRQVETRAAVAGDARPLYLQRDADAPSVFAWLHSPPAGMSEDGAAILMCPPFGWHEVCSYRSRRAWCEHLAALGHPALRIDLPGSGHSAGGPGDRDLLRCWTETIADAADWLRIESSRERVVAIGIGLGGLLAAHAACSGASIDGLALWAVPATGRPLLREMRAAARMEEAKLRSRGEIPEAQLPDGWSSYGGFVLSAETARSLEALDIACTPDAPAFLRDALLLDRDGLASDERLRKALAIRGVDVSCAPGPGYGAMMAEPQEASPPLAVFADVADWLAGVDKRSMPSMGDRPQPAPSTAPASQQRARLMVDGQPIFEEPVAVDASSAMTGILSTPPIPGEHGLCAVLLNPGAIRSIGPNRMWVEIARRWAARGVPSLRVDFEGIGDTDGDGMQYADAAAFHTPEREQQVIDCLDLLTQRGVGERFVLVGLCSGSYWAFQGALRDRRVAAALMLNPRMLFWDPTRDVVRYVRRGMLLPSSWRMIVKQQVAGGRILSVLRRAPTALLRHGISHVARRRSRQDDVALALRALRATNTQLLFAFSGEEPLQEELAREGRLVPPSAWPNVRIETLPGYDHVLRPLAAQRAAHAALDRALDRELARTRP